MTPDTLITAEILAGLDKCPFCGEVSEQYVCDSQKIFGCGSGFTEGVPASEGAEQSCLVQHENTTLRARVKELEAVVNDPEALWANWLRGTVKLPSGIGDVRKIQELENQERGPLLTKIQRLVEAGDFSQKTLRRFDTSLLDTSNMNQYNPAAIEGLTVGDLWKVDQAITNWTKAKEGL